MAIDIESALAGQHGPEFQKLAEKAVRDAIERVGRMFAHASPGVGGLATGGAFSAPATGFRFNSGEYIVPRSVNDEIQKRALAQGYTELRFNPETMGWAWHKPDQAEAPDAHRYIAVRGV